MRAVPRWLRALGRPAVIAHRGASHHAPENSLLALRLCRELGADMVEFDVQRCGSGELVVFHDRTLARCTGRVARLDETPLERLRDLTLDRLDEAAGRAPTRQRIPTLEEWLGAAPAGLFLNLEAKVDVAAHADVGGDCARALARAGATVGSVLSSFHPAALASARTARPDIARGALVEGSGGWPVRLALGVSTGAATVHPHHSLVTAARVALWHRLGWAVLAWTVDDPREAQRCLEAGVDGLITNRPDLMRPLCEQARR